MSGTDSPRLLESYWPAETTTAVEDVTLGEVIRRNVARVPDRLALVDGQSDPSARREWTYAELLAESEQAARALLATYAPGDRIAIFAPNSPEWIILQQALGLAGLIMVAINPAYRSSELRFVLKQSGAKAIFYTDSYRGADLAAIVAEVRPDTPELVEAISFATWSDFLATADPDRALPEVAPLDPIQIQYTSGTTGFPKGALLHHKGVVNEARFVGERAGMRDGAVCINAMPMYHIGGGAVTEFGTLSVAGTYVVMPGFDPALILEMFEAYHGTHSLVVPTMLMAMLEHSDLPSRDMSSVETIMSGASSVPASLVRRTIETLGCRVSILFGQTEMHGVTNQTRLTDSAEDQSETVGQPLPQLEMKIADPATGDILANDEQGEICCRGYQNMLAYYELPDETAATIDGDGWLHMGDLGSMDDRGFVKVTGRLKDMIIRGGMNIYPREIEELLITHPAVADATVIGVPDESWGERVGAVLRLTDPSAPPQAEELKAFCRERMADFKTPSAWYFVEEYPMTPSGKIQKFALKARVESGELVPAAMTEAAAPQ